MTLSVTCLNKSIQKEMRLSFLEMGLEMSLKLEMLKDKKQLTLMMPLTD
ncbi:MAG: hypothetical protein ACJARO_000953 [Bacteriovoracaceae bacterium]|jgi:hypothetical protein